MHDLGHFAVHRHGTADHIRADLFLREMAERSYHFHFFVADAVGAQIGRRFHRDQAEKLE